MSKAWPCLAAVLALGCADSEGARRALETDGYSQIEITGWRLNSCPPASSAATGFAARHPLGHPVTGYVCGGLYGGDTIALDPADLEAN